MFMNVTRHLFSNMNVVMFARILKHVISLKYVCDIEKIYVFMIVTSIHMHTCKLADP